MPYMPVFDEITELVRKTGKEIVLPVFEGRQDLGLVYKKDEVQGQKFQAEKENPLTYADSRCQKALEERLEMLFPLLKAHPELKNLKTKIIAEENDLTPKAREDFFRTFHGEGINSVIDPVDGTVNFARGAVKLKSKQELNEADREFSVLLALVVNGIALAGWMYAPCQDMMFTAHVGQGAFLNGKKIALHEAPADPGQWQGGIAELHPANYADALVEEIYLNGADKRVPFVELRKRASAFGCVIDVKNCCSWAYIKMLMGKLHFAVMPGLKPWDHLAPALILKEAGGYAARFDGVPYLVSDPGPDLNGKINLVSHDSNSEYIPYRGGMIVAANPEMCNTVYRIFHVPYVRNSRLLPHFQP